MSGIGRPGEIEPGAGQQALLYGENLVNYEHPPLVKLVAALPVLISGRPLAPRMVGSI